MVPIIFLSGVTFFKHGVAVHCNDVSTFIINTPKKHRKSVSSFKLIYVSIS